MLEGPQRRIPRGRGDEQQLTEDIVALAGRYGRYGYRKIAELLRSQVGSRHRANELSPWIHQYNWHRPHGGI